MRPAELADDYAGTVPVVRHAVQWCIDDAQAPQLACCIYATAPFVSPSDIVRGYELLRDASCDYVFSVTAYASPIQRALRINDDRRVEMFEPKYFDVRSQDLEPAYHDAAQFYWGRTHAWLAEMQIFNSDSAPVVLPRHRVQDIDSWDDWTRAESMFRSIQAGKETGKQ